MTTPTPSPRTLPSGADIARIVFGYAILLFVFFSRATSPPGREMPYVFATLFTILFFAVIFGVPAYLIRGRRGDWRGFARLCGNGLLIIGGVGLAGLVYRGPARQQPSPLVESLRTGQITIDAFLRAQRAAAPRAFDMRFAGERGRDLRSAGLNVSEVELTDVTEASWWMRTRIRFSAPVPQRADAGAARWRQVVYYHARGSAVLVSICSPPVTDCSALERTLDKADQNLQERVAAGDLDYVLPETGHCETERVDAPGVGQAPVRACHYGEGQALTFMRLDAATTISDLARTETP